MSTSNHAPERFRSIFLNAIDAFANWRTGPEPVVEDDAGDEPRSITLVHVCRLVWNCTDVVPRLEFDRFADDDRLEGIPVRRQTYAACARAMKRALKAA